MTALLADVLRKTLNGFEERLVAFGPNLLAMLVIVIAGVALAGVVHVAVRLLLPALGFDRFAGRVGFRLLLQRGGVTRPPSQVVALALAWGVLAVFLLLGIGALNLQFAVNLVSSTFFYLPQLLIAVVLLALGSLVGSFVRRTVLIAAVNAGLPSARLLAGGAQAAIMMLVLAMALEHLGVGRQIILISFAILFGGMVLALALSFGLAGRDLAREFLENALRRRPPDQRGENTLRHL